MTYFMILTALSVSVDSFFCGFSLSNKVKNKLVLILTIALTVFVMCRISTIFAYLFSNFITEKTASIGGVILIALGIYNLCSLKKNDSQIKKPIKQRSDFYQSLLCGFAVGLDGATASLSLYLLGINAFYVCYLIAFTHALFIWFGVLLSNIAFAKKFEKFSFVAPLILIFLGGYKLIGLIA